MAHKSIESIKTADVFSFCDVAGGELLFQVGCFAGEAAFASLIEACMVGINDKPSAGTP